MLRLPVRMKIARQLSRSHVEHDSQDSARVITHESKEMRFRRLVRGTGNTRNRAGKRFLAIHQTRNAVSHGPPRKVTMDSPSPQMHFIDVSPIISSKRLSRRPHSPDTYWFQRQTRICASIPFPRQRRNVSARPRVFIYRPALEGGYTRGIPRFF